jgi:EpsI family protein
MNRRALFAGAACAGGALLAHQLKPNKYVSLLGSAKLGDLIPRRFEAWTSEDVGDPLALNGPESLSAKLYNQLVTRAYTASDGQQVVMLVAYGERQSDELQLHRPEVCYPAFGFDLLRNETATLRLSETVGLPGRQLLAKSPSWEESAIYWTRLGEYFPTSGSQQRKARFENTFAGLIPDGVLCRLTTGDTSDDAWRRLEAFARGLIAAAPPQGRQVLIGSELSQKLVRA